MIKIMAGEIYLADKFSLHSIAPVVHNGTTYTLALLWNEQPLFAFSEAKYAGKVLDWLKAHEQPANLEEAYEVAALEFIQSMDASTGRIAAIEAPATGI